MPSKSGSGQIDPTTDVTNICLGLRSSPARKVFVSMHIINNVQLNKSFHINTHTL